MKNKSVLVLLGIATLISIGLSSCDDKKTYAQLLKEEKKYIERFWGDSIVVRDVERNAQGDTVFQKYEGNKMVFYRVYGPVNTSECVYVHIIDSGYKDSQGKYIPIKVKPTSKVSVRLYAGRDLALNKLIIDNSWDSSPLSFYYRRYATDGCEGFIIPLDFVYEGAKVKLLVPSKLGLAEQRTNTISPVYYERVTYTSLANDND